MRIATSTIYSQQTASIDNLSAEYSIIGNQLSTGKSFNAPSDDPTQVGRDLAVRTKIANESQSATNVQSATSELTTTDGALANVTSILQSARQLAVQGATDSLTPGQRQSIANQVDQLLQQTVAIANTDYGGRYIFAGSAPSAVPPVSTQGNPISGITFTGNEQSQGQLLYNNQQFALSTTIQQSFNYKSTDGSPDVFQVLQNLRNTLDKGTVVDQSAASINQKGQVIYGPATAGVPAGAAPAPTTLASPTAFATKPAADSAGTYAIEINNADVNGGQHVNAYTFTGATAVDDGTATSIVGQINANSAATGLTAAFNVQTQRLVLTNTGGGAFYVKDTPSAGATNTSNFTAVFGLTGQADLPQTISTQLGDIDNALNVVLNARSVVGSRINALTQIGNQVSQDSVDNIKVQSQIEDVNVASATTQFSATQTALQAAFATTTKLESKTLFDYL